MLMRVSSFILVVFLLLPLLAMAQVSVEPMTQGGERLKFQTPVPITPLKAFSLTNPNRIVIDVPKMAGQGIALPPGYKGKLLKAIRFGQFDAATSRIVLDLKQPASVVSSTPGAPFMIDIAPAGITAVEVPQEIKKPLVVIDAGHGGQDPGAIGLHKTREKDVTLSFARGLRDALLATGNYRVQLTRDTDTFIMLQDRVAIARKAKADMFISFHADSNPKPEARGLSIYTLSENASDDEAAALADRENKADIISGIDLNTTDADVASILIDLTQRETMNKSATLADAVVEKLRQRVNLLQGTHRFAGFRVLKAPDIPSVLIELGFLTNQQDERLLLSADYREQIISSVVKGIDRYRAQE